MGQDGTGGAAVAPNHAGGGMENSQGYSHDGGQGAVAGRLVETLHVADGFLRVLEAAFGGGEVGWEGKGEML